MEPRSEQKCQCAAVAPISRQLTPRLQLNCGRCVIRMCRLPAQPACMASDVRIDCNPGINPRARC
eukprot:1061014-Amphidinium_carterae.1